MNGTIAEPIHVTDAAFEKTVLQSPLPVLVDFWAPWCNPCRQLAPLLEKLAQEYAGRLLVAKVNTDEEQEWAGRFGVQGIPNLVFIAGGKLIYQQAGFLPYNLLKQLVDRFLAVVASPTAD